MRVFVFNVDAELELAGHTLPSGVRASKPSFASLPFLKENDSLVPPKASPGQFRGSVGAAWCPTPKALERLRYVGAKLPNAPAPEVLRHVNHRRFCAELGQNLPGASFATAEAEVFEVLSRGGSWLLKRPLSMAGRGIRAVEGGALRSEDCAFVRSSFRRYGGLQVEPRVPILQEFALHGEIEQRGFVTFHRPIVQQVDSRGVWRGASLAGALLEQDEQKLLISEGQRVAHALAEAQYFGPFGIDAFRYNTQAGPRFQPRSEINARYTMSWGLGHGPAGG